MVGAPTGCPPFQPTDAVGAPTVIGEAIGEGAIAGLGDVAVGAPAGGPPFQPLGAPTVIGETIGEEAIAG